MSGQRAPSSSPMPPQPQPFRFWLPFRSNAGSWRQQPRPPSSRPIPSSPQPPPTPPTPAEHPRSRAHAVEEDIPIQAESSDESDRLSVQSSGSSQLRGGSGPSMADMELTLTGAPPTGHEQSSGRGGGNDTKIAISEFPRSRLFDGARAPYRQEIEDGLKSLGAGREPRPESGQGYRVITLAGHNVGASMVVGGGGPREAQAEAAAATPTAAEPEDPGLAARPPPAVAANVNSNVQNVNNSSIEGSTCSTGNPGVHVDIKSAREEPPPPTREDEKPKRRPPLAVPATAPEKSAAAAPAKARPRRCLRSLMMENGSDTEAARKPKPSACKFQCVADHKPPAPTSNGGGAGSKNAEDGGNSGTKEAN